MDKELSYWLALNEAQKLNTKRKHDIVVRLFEQGKSLIDFFHLDAASQTTEFELTHAESESLKKAHSELSNYAVKVEDLLNQGYSIIPITSEDYSPILKKNLGRSNAPLIIYTKGNLEIMKEKSIAIVGSRNAHEKSLIFTDTIARKATEEYKVVVSGFARGIDRQALESALEYKGQSIIVLPQGITTFKSGFKKYYKEIIGGDLLVLSTFTPKASWSVGLAMARNPIIYGLASEIYVAESNNKGGTWAGVKDGLKKGRTIYVRKPDTEEKNANELLISEGAMAVDAFGTPLGHKATENRTPKDNVTEKQHKEGVQTTINFEDSTPQK